MDPADAAAVAALDALPRPRHVGVLALEVYVPQGMVDQSELETHDGVAAGKYTSGLGQAALAVVTDREDALSMALTVVQSLLDKWGVDPARIGRIEVGSESNPDRAKPLKAGLMRLFGGASDACGADCVAACYGATSALLSAAHWVESSSWDGRLALVVASDVAAYAPGAARPTGGAGAAAALVGPNAPLALEPVWRASHTEDAWDFYKPAGGGVESGRGPFPVVDGPESVACYLRALDSCYTRLWDHGLESQAFRGLESVGHVVLHAPFAKLVRKAHARLAWLDARARSARGLPPLAADAPMAPALAAAAGTPLTTPWVDRAAEAAAVAAASGRHEAQVAPAGGAARACGNVYTASVLASLASLVETRGESLIGGRVLVYSYGSGMTASVFCLRCRAITDSVTDSAVNDTRARVSDTRVSDASGAAPSVPWGIGTLRDRLGLASILSHRTRLPPSALGESLTRLAETHAAVGGWAPAGDVGGVRPGAWYLTGVDADGRRAYARREAD